MRNNKFSFYIYYLLLLLIMVMRSSMVAPSVLLRFSFIFIFLVPFLFKKKEIFPAILTSFMIIGTYGYAYNYLPYEMSMYFYMSLLIIIFNAKSCRRNQVTVLYVISLLFVIFSNLMDGLQL
jgi:hypothetical protein